MPVAAFRRTPQRRRSSASLPKRRSTRSWALSTWAAAAAAEGRTAANAPMPIRIVRRGRLELVTRFLLNRGLATQIHTLYSLVVIRRSPSSHRSDRRFRAAASARPSLPRLRKFGSAAVRDACCIGAPCKYLIAIARKFCSMQVAPYASCGRRRCRCRPGSRCSRPSDCRIRRPCAYPRVF
jgi:hypothetical protein